ncbi:metallophosphoesterase family protein [Nocardioides sp. AX2bis]|uniref:metallophosphoesterase family protein n=1 Tax=Nocardioides sp. AX2bis TaxID=2653157 RepID=UPI0012F1CA60|nr:metallophosphoesterase [Nocardioides sp. AX2bis]VXC49513.1 conserved exported hypothetical protein [Nocardioides sp. AX2bis]
MSSRATTRSFTSLVGAAAVVAGLLGAGATPAGADDRAAPPDYRFVSSPDFLNMDLADLTGLPTWSPGLPTGTSPQHERALDVVLDGIAAEAPQDVLVAGDLVEGHWSLDDAGTGLFGPVRTERQQQRAVVRAARSYYPAWLTRFREHGLPLPHTAVGDHELGDNPWGRRGGGYSGFKWRNLGLFRQLYADALVAPRGYAAHPRRGPARSTAYATSLDPEVLLVTLDVFSRTRNGVVAEVDPAQLRWLRGVLRGARRTGVDWVVVQGHTPVLGPVRTVGSSGLMYEGGRGSPLWRTLVRHDVDLYLAGEVHDVTAVRDRGVTQVSHGGLFGYGGTNYLVGEVRGDEMSLVVRRFRSQVDGTERIWQTDTRRGQPLDLTYEPDPPAVGTMTLTADGRVRGRDGLLAPYRPATARAGSTSVDPLPGVRE